MSRENYIKITLIGNYGINNLGDEMILLGLSKIVKSAFPLSSITVLSSNPKFTFKSTKLNSLFYLPCGFRSTLKSFFSLNLFRTLKQLITSDLIILGGGGLFTDEVPKANLIWSIQLLPAIFLNKKIFMLGQSLGPINRPLTKLLITKFFKQSKLTIFRDQKSVELLKTLSSDLKSEALTDFAFAISYEENQNYTRKNFITLSLRHWPNFTSKTLELIAEYLNWLNSTYNFEICFIPFQTIQKNDLSIFHKLQTLLNKPKWLYYFKASPKQAIKIIAQSKLTLGMRLHSIIFSVMTATPFLSLSYSSKVNDFVSELNLPINPIVNLNKQENFLNELKTITQNLLENPKQNLALQKASMLHFYKSLEYEKKLKSFF